MSVMNTKWSTKTWSPSAQESSLKGDNKNYASATQTGIPEGKELGDYLNEIADPNYVPPEKMRKVGNPSLDKDAFFKLMLAQVKYQDPTNPMKSDQMASQLAQFTSLEQLQNMNSKLDDLAKAQQPATQFQALNFIGKTVASDTSKIVRTVGDKMHDMRFTLPKDAASVTVTIKNENGESVRQYDMKNMKQGENKVSWNGYDKQGSPTTAGEYYFEIAAVGSTGEKIAAQTAVRGVVSGVNYTTEGPVLLVGNQSVKLNDVKKIEDGMLNPDQTPKMANNPKLALNNTTSTEENNIEGAKPPRKSNLDAIAMSQQMIDETNKALEQVNVGDKK